MSLVAQRARPRHLGRQILRHIYNPAEPLRRPHLASRPALSAKRSSSVVCCIESLKSVFARLLSL
jgi:hypothetical protein